MERLLLLFKLFFLVEFFLIPFFKKFFKACKRGFAKIACIVGFFFI